MWTCSELYLLQLPRIYTTTNPVVSRIYLSTMCTLTNSWAIVQWVWECMRQRPRYWKNGARQNSMSKISSILRNQAKQEQTELTRPQHHSSLQYMRLNNKINFGTNDQMDDWTAHLRRHEERPWSLNEWEVRRRESNDLIACSWHDFEHSPEPTGIKGK